MTLGVLVMIPAAAEASSRVSGDFNGDGRDDLAIGVPQENEAAIITNSGAVNVIYGGPSGLTPNDDEIWTQATPGIKDKPETDDRFGASLAAGDFNGDRRDDLAIGVPGEEEGPIPNAGVVNVIYGGPSGLTPNDDQIWSQGSPGIKGTPETNDRFGAVLTAGDFNGDVDDLAIGVPQENAGSPNTGAVHVIHGSSFAEPPGLTPDADQLWTQGNGIEGEPEEADVFGASLAAGDFGGTSDEDLAIGVPDDTLGPKAASGTVNVLYGSFVSGLTTADDEIWGRASAGIEGAPQFKAEFGASLAAGDFGGDRKDDLAIGVPDDDVGPINDAGAVNVIYGGETGLTPNDDDIWTQGSPGIKDKLELDDRFGVVLTAGDFGGTLQDDLAIGVPDENEGPIVLSGMVHVIYGGASGLTPNDDDIWTQASPGIKGTPENSDYFGSSLPG